MWSEIEQIKCVFIFSTEAEKNYLDFYLLPNTEPIFQ